MQDKPRFTTDTPPNPTASRLVLLGLLAPVIALGVVLWFFLPGGLAGRTYAPSAYAQQVQLAPLAWQHRTVTLRGYLAWTCDAPAAACPRGLWLFDRPLPRHADPLPIPSGGVHVLPQGEAGWHAALRRLIPGLAVPFPQGAAWNQRISVTGDLAGAPGPATPVTLQPRTL